MESRNKLLSCIICSGQENVNLSQNDWSSARQAYSFVYITYCKSFKLDFKKPINKLCVVAFIVKPQVQA